MILLYNFSYINKAFNVQNRSFTREYLNLLSRFNYIDSFFLYLGQRVYVSILGPEFFDGDKCEAFHKLGTDTIILNFIRSYETSNRGQYALFQDPLKSYDICFLPFSWYSRDAIYNTDSAFIRAIDNVNYQIQSIGFTPLTWVNERTEHSIYSNPLAAIAYSSNGDLIPYKIRPNGQIQNYSFFKLSFPSVIDTLLIYVLIPENQSSAPIANIVYGDDAWENRCDVALKNGLNNIYMFQDNPTNPRVYEVLAPQLRSFTPIEPYYGYQQLPEFIPGTFTYNSDRTLTKTTSLVNQHYGFYRYNYIVSQAPLSIIFITTPLQLSNTKIILYDNFKAVSLEADLINFFTSASKYKFGKLISNAYVSCIMPDPLINELVVKKTGAPFRYTFGNGNINNYFNQPMLKCVDSFVENSNSITIGSFVSNSNHFCFGIYDFTTFNLGDLSLFNSNLLSNITSSVNETWNYTLYFISISGLSKSSLSENQTINFYKKLSFPRTSISYPSFEYDELTSVIIHIWSDDGIIPPFPQPQHYGYYKKLFSNSGSINYTNKYFMYKPALPFNTIDNNCLITYNSSGNGVIQYDSSNSSFGLLNNYYFYNFLNTNINQYKYISRTCNNVAIQSTVDRVYSSMSTIDMKLARAQVFAFGKDSNGVTTFNNNTNHYAESNFYCVLRVRIDTFVDNGTSITFGPPPGNPQWGNYPGIWCAGLEYSVTGTNYIPDYTFYGSNIHGKAWMTGINSKIRTTIYLFDVDVINSLVSYNTTTNYYAKYVFEPTDNWDFDMPYDRLTKILFLFSHIDTTEFEYSDYFTSTLTFYSCLTPRKLLANSLYRIGTVDYAVRQQTSRSPISSCVPDWDVYCVPSSNFYKSFYGVSFTAGPVNSLFLTSKSYKQTGIKNYVFYITYQIGYNNIWYFYPATTNCDPASWIQEGDFISLNIANLTTFFVNISTQSKTITANEIYDNVEIYHITVDTGMSPLASNINLSSTPGFNICNIGNSIDGTVDQFGLPVALGEIILNTPAPPTLNDWLLSENISIPISSNQLFANSTCWNSTDGYSISLGLAPWETEQTFNNNLALSSCIYLDKSFLIDSLHFYFTSDQYSLSRISDYQIMFYFNTLPLTTWTWSSYFIENDNIVFGGQPTFDIVCVQIKKLSAPITYSDVLTLKVYYSINDLGFSIPFNLESENIVSIGNSFDTSKDLINNNVPIGFAVKNIPTGNDHMGVWELDLINCENCVLAINHTFPFYENSTLILRDASSLLEFNFYSGSNSFLNLFIPNLTTPPLKLSYTQQTSFNDVDSYIQVNKVKHSDYFQHVWLGELYAVDPTTNYGTRDVSSNFNIFNFVDSWNDSSNIVTVGNLVSNSSYLVMNLDVGQADYTYFGSNIFFNFSNINVPLDHTYTIYRISSADSNIISFSSSFTYYSKNVYPSLSTINISEFFSIIPSRIILLISAPIISLASLISDTIKVGTLPQKLFTNKNYLNYSNNYTCRKTSEGQFGNTWSFSPQFNAQGGIRINGFANSVNNPNIGAFGGFFFETDVFSKTTWPNYKYCFFSNSIDSTLTDNFIYQPVLDDGNGYFFLPSQYDNNFIYFQISNLALSFADPLYIYENCQVLLGTFPDFNFPISQLQLFSSTYNAINFGNTIDGQVKEDGSLVEVNELIPIPVAPKPPPGTEGYFIVGPILLKGQNIKLNFSRATDADFFIADIYLSDSNDNQHYNIWGTNLMLQDESIYSNYMVDTKPNLLRGITTGTRRNTTIFAPGNTITLPNTGGSVSIQVGAICSIVQSLGGVLPSRCSNAPARPSAIIIVPINKLYDYTITLPYPCIDIIFGAKQPYAGQPLLSDQGLSKYEYANKFAIGYDTEEAPPSPWGNSTLARSVLFPSMTDFYNNYAYSIAPTAKHIDSSRITLVEQEWKNDSTYIYHPESSSANVIVNLQNTSIYSNDLQKTYDFYNTSITGINTNIPYCNYNEVMRDGIRIFKSYFNMENYLNMENVLSTTCLIQRINWTVVDSTIPLYQSQSFIVGSRDNFSNSKRVGAYVPFIGEQTPNVTIQSSFNNWTSCILFSDVAPIKRGQWQPLFIQNNKNRTINFVKHFQTKQFTFLCSQTPQYIFLCFQ